MRLEGKRSKSELEAANVSQSLSPDEINSSSDLLSTDTLSNWNGATLLARMYFHFSFVCF